MNQRPTLFSDALRRVLVVICVLDAAVFTVIAILAFGDGNVTRGVLSSLLALVGLAGGFGPWSLARRRTLSSHDGPRRNESRAEVTLSFPKSDAMARLQRALGALGQVDVTRLDGEEGYIEATVGRTGNSWGEELLINVRSAPVGSTIEVISRSRFQLLDHGKNKRNIDRILQQLQAPQEPR
jgi:hypothetical protein